MLRWNACLLLLLLMASGAAWAQTDPAVPHLVLKPKLRVTATAAEYKARDGAAIPIDIYRPAGPAKGAVIFVSGTEDARHWNWYRDYGQLAAERGLVGIVAAKRFPRAAAPRDIPRSVEAAFRDTQDLLNALGSGALEGVDAAKTCVWVFSGGGLSLAAAYAPESVEPACAVAYYPATAAANFQGAAETSAEWRARYIATDVIRAHGGPEAPPLLLIRAGKDSPLVNNNLSGLAMAALESNTAAEVINLPDALHGFDALNDTDWSRRAMEQSFDFVLRATGG